MSARVCGKRSSSIFDELLLDSSPVSKRIHCSPSASSPTAAARFSPPQAPSNDSAAVYLGHLARLRSLFPAMDQQLLERALEATGNDLDSAVRSLTDLHLESVELGFSAAKLDPPTEANAHRPTEAMMGNNGGHAASENQSATDNLPKDGSEWVDLFVTEMMSATDVGNARARAFRLLEVLEKSIMRANAETNEGSFRLLEVLEKSIMRANAETNEGSHKEAMMLKEHVQVLLRENSILKRAVAIQHEVRQEYTVRDQDLQHLKQLVSQYQEQLKTLEMNNYALTMHLKQAQQSSSIPGHFHPHIF